MIRQNLYVKNFAWKGEGYMAEIKLYGCTINYLKNPCGIDENPRFSYKISSDGRGGKQLSRRIRVSDALTRYGTAVR